MRLFFEKLLKSFDYHSWGDFGASLAPSYKYNLTLVSMGVSAITVPIEKVADTLFGLDGLAFIALLCVFFTELVSGLGAAHVRKEKISSLKLSRFSFKVAYYLVLIAVPYLMHQSFHSRGKDLAATIFDWLHIFLVVQIVLENIVSILENLAVLTGKDKTHWITKIQDKLNAFLS